MRECRDAAGNQKAGCLIDNGTSPTGTAVRNKMATAADRTQDAAATAADRTKDAAATAAEKTREAAHDVAQRTEAATDRAAVKADHMAAIGHSAGRNVDLKAAAAERLRALGAMAVEDVGVCTICDERFFSHRRDRGVTGRQAGVVCRA